MIKQILTENTNIIEIYLMNKQKPQVKMNIYLDDLFLNRIKKRFKMTRETTLRRVVLVQQDFDYWNSLQFRIA